MRRSPSGRGALPAGLLAAFAAFLATGCPSEPTSVPPPRPPPPAASAPATATPPPRAPGVVTLLYTTDEHGWLFGHGNGDKARGGAAEALATWLAHEQHCPHPPPDPRALDARAPEGCKDPSTILLSGGDNFTGPAVSSYFAGLPMAEAMAKMGYVASAFGNHEYDFHRAAFDANRAASGVTYLAANVRVIDPAKDPHVRPSLIVERRGLRIGIVGVATEDTPRQAAPSRFAGLAFDPPEPALDRAIDATYRAGADAVAILAHACEDEIAPIVDRHPEWRVAFVGLGHCHRRIERTAAGAPMLMPGWRLDTYARVTLAIDPARPARDRVTSVQADLVDVRLRDGLTPDHEIAAIRDAARTKVDAALGTVIGYSATGMDDDSEAMGRWITRALRDELQVDVAVNNTSSIRESLAKGPITKASIHSIVPFENEVYTLEVTGAVLARVLAERAFVAAGARRTEVPGKQTQSGKPVHEVRLDNGALVDPAKTYTLALTDFLYDVGKEFDFKSADPTPTRTGIDWRTPIITWTTKLATSDKTPLESKLGGSTKPPPRKKKASKSKGKATP